jgi:hypothetical protein
VIRKNLIGREDVVRNNFVLRSRARVHPIRSLRLRRWDLEIRAKALSITSGEREVTNSAGPLDNHPTMRSMEPLAAFRPTAIAPQA